MRIVHSKIIQEKRQGLFEKSRPYSALWTTLGTGLLIILLYHDTLSGWWRWDDPHILQQALSQSPVQYFFSSEAYQFLSSRNFTPLLPFSFDLDLHFFGLNPSFFYARQLLSLWLAGLLSYMILKLSLSEWWSAFGALLCICGAPVSTVVHQLMDRHYLDGLVLALASLYLFLTAIRKRHPSRLITGAICYFLAMAAKEVFVPISMVCLLWPEGSLKKRIRATIPYFILFLAYMAWRIHLIGVAGGGYALQWNTALLFPFLFCNASFGDSILGAVIGIISALSMILIFKPKKLSLIVFAASILCAIAVVFIPLGPSANAARYFFVPWWAFSMGSAALLGKYRFHNRIPHGINFLILTLIAFGALIQNHTQMQVIKPMLDRFDNEGRYVWKTNRSTVLYAPRTTAFMHYFSALQWIKEHVTGVSPMTKIVGDEIELQYIVAHESADIMAYNFATHSIQNLTTQVPAIIDTWKKRQRVQPLFLTLNYGKDKIINWKCGPYKSGTYTLLARDRYNACRQPFLGFSKFFLSLSGQWRVNLEKPLSLYLRYDSPQGWTTYSPELYFDPRNQHFQWERKADIESE